MQVNLVALREGSMAINISHYVIQQKMHIHNFKIICVKFVFTCVTIANVDVKASFFF